MYPDLFRIGSFEVTSFGVLLAVAALVGIWIFARELERGGLAPEAQDAAIAGVVGGLIGAKLLWTLEFLDGRPLAELLFSRGGLSWFGGPIGGVGTGLAATPRSRSGCAGAVSRARGFDAIRDRIHQGQRAVVRAADPGAPDFTDTGCDWRRNNSSTTNTHASKDEGDMRRTALALGAFVLLNCSRM
jgi:prolipoprotein diacylglyceryltransferase